MSSCGRSKSCYRNPPNCEGLQCDAVVTWRSEGSYVDFELSAQTDGWVAVGLSQDCRMVGGAHYSNGWSLVYLTYTWCMWYIFCFICLLFFFQGNDDITECVWNSDRGVIAVSKSFNAISGKSNSVVESVNDISQSFALSRAYQPIIYSPTYTPLMFCCSRQTLCGKCWTRAAP